MATLRELMIEIGIDADMKGLGQLEKGLSDVMDVAKAVGVAIVGASAAVFGLAKSTANYADKIQDTAWAIGMTNEELQTLGHASQLSGGSVEQAAEAMKFLSRNLVEAASGSQVQAEAFAKLGVRATDSTGKVRDTNAVFSDLADAFQAMPQGAEKTAVALDIFGRAGAKMIPLLNAGSQGISAMRQEAKDLGLVLDDASIQAGSDFNDAFDRMKAVFTGLKNSIGAAVLPAMQKLLDTLREIVVANFDIIKGNLTRFFQGLVKVIQYATTFIGFMAGGFRRLSDVVGGIIPLLKTLGFLLMSMMLGKAVIGIANMAKGFLGLAKSITMANLSAMALPILIGAAIALAALVVEDFIAFLDGRPSVLGFILKNSDKILAKIKSIINSVLDWIDGAFNKLFDWMQIGIQKFFEFFGVPSNEAAKAAKTITDVFRVAYQAIKDGLSQAIDFFVAQFKFIVDSVKPMIANIVAIFNEPMLFFTRFPELVRQSFQLVIGLISNLVTKFISEVLTLIGVPKDAVDSIVEYIKSAFSSISEVLGGIVETAISLVTDGIAAMIFGIKKSVKGVAGLINMVSDFFKGDDKEINVNKDDRREDTVNLVNKDDRREDTVSLVKNLGLDDKTSLVNTLPANPMPSDTKPITQGAMSQVAETNFNNRTSNNSTTVSPTINVTVGGAQEGGMSTADDIARAIRDEIAGVAQSMSKSSQPQFAQ